jgi:hypothetical protein
MKLLFNILRRANLQTTGTIYNKETQILAYADDIYIVGRSQSAVRDAFLAVQRKAAIVGLKINDRTIRDVGQSVAISNKHFEVIKEFVRQQIGVFSVCANICGRGEENHLLLFERKVFRTI